MSNLLKAAFVSLSIVPFGFSPAAAQANETPVKQAEPLLMAQAESCRQITSRISGLNVRASPSLAADVVGVIPGGRTVTLENLGTAGWAPITEPFVGFVSSSYLTPCEPIAATPTVSAAPTTETAQCRQVMVRSGLNVRAQPTRYSNRLGALPTGTNVQLSGDEVNNWLPISEPIEGYVAARFLGECR